MVARRTAKLLLLLLPILFAGPGWAQTFPSKVVRIVTGEAGGTNDLVARVIAQGTAPGLGQSVIVENRPSSLIGGYAAAAPPDGHVIVVAGSTFMIEPLLQKKDYDPAKDFAPITMAISQPYVLVVHPTLPAKSVKDLVALAKAHPGTLNYGSTGTGGILHLAAELFKSLAKIDVVRIPYKGTAQATNDLLAGQVQLAFLSMGLAAPHVKSGRLRIVALTSARPSTLYPELPTIAATGLPGYEAVTLVAAFAPAKTPASAIGRLNQEMVRTLNQPDVKEKFAAAGAETAPSTPEQLAAALKSEITKWSKVISDAKIKVE